MKKSKISELLPNNSKIINIDSVKEKGIPKIKEKEGYFELAFYLDKSIIYNDSEYNRFIKATESLVRKSQYYKDYIANLKLRYGLNHCMILSNVQDLDGVTIEMHHGPLLNLYDVCSLITNHFLFNDKKISTFKIADIVLKEHFLNNVQVIMLCKTVHQLVHKGKIFISPKQCIGDINTLLEKYEDGITSEMSEGINKYIEMSEKYETTENGLLKIDSLMDWSKEKDFEELIKEISK